MLYNKNDWRGSGGRMDSQCGIPDVPVEVIQSDDYKEDRRCVMTMCSNNKESGKLLKLGGGYLKSKMFQPITL